MRFSGVVRFQARVKVFRKTGVEPIPVGLGLKDVSVIEFHGPSAFARQLRGDKLRFSPNTETNSNGVPRRSFIRLRLKATARQIKYQITVTARLRQGASARHTSLRPKFRSEVWRRRESNPRPRTFRQNIYILSLHFKFASQTSHRQDAQETILFGFASPL